MCIKTMLNYLSRRAQPRTRQALLERFFNLGVTRSDILQLTSRASVNKWWLRLSKPSLKL